MKAMRAPAGAYGGGVGALGGQGTGKMGMPVPVAPAPPPAEASPHQWADKAAKSKGEKKAAKDDRDEEMQSRRDASRSTTTKAPATTVTWTVKAGNASGVGGTAPLVEAIRAALASGRASCLAVSTAGTTIRIRLTVDAQGRVVRVELIAGDRNAESCLRGALVGLSSATIAHAPAQVPTTGTVEITLHAR